MSVGPFVVHNVAKFEWANHTTDLAAATLVAVLVDVAHTPDAETDATYADISANECDDVDYAPVVLAGKAWTRSTSTSKFDANLVNYGTAVTIAAKYMYIVVRAGGSLAGTDRVLGRMDLNVGVSANLSSDASDFSVDFNLSNGMMRV